MKNKKYLAVAMLAGLTVGGLSVASVASAQGYGSDRTDESAEVEETNTDATEGTLLQVQDEADDAEGTENDGRNRRGGCNLETAAAAIGIEEADLRAALEDGSSIADVAEANGVSADDVIDAMVDAKTDRIAEKVESGRITQEQADEKLAELEDKISDRVNGVDDDASEDDAAEA